MSFEIVYNDALKIFSKQFVGIKPLAPNQTGAPLGFATPYEETAAGLKRQATVKSWVGEEHYYWDVKTRRQVKVEGYVPDFRVVDNVPLSGFKITDEVKRVYYGGGNVVWRIEDPRGWEVEIQSNNLMALLQSVGVSAGGVINGECIWARDGSHNVLIPTSSDEYKNAIKAAEAIKPKAKVPAKDRVVGRTYRLLDGTFGTYLGKMHVRTFEHDYGNRYGYMTINHNGKFTCPTHVFSSDIHNSADTEQYEAVFFDERELGNEYHSYKSRPTVRFYKSAPLIEELDKMTFSREKAVELANNSDKEFASGKGSQPFYVSLEPNPKARYVVEPASAEKIAEARAELLKNMETLEEHYERARLDPNHWGVIPKPVHTIGKSMYGPGLIVQIGDKLFSRSQDVTLFETPTDFSFMTGGKTRKYEVVTVLGRVLLSDHRKQEIQADQGYGGLDHRSNSQYAGERWYDAYVLKKHVTIEAALEEFDTLAAAGSFKQLKVEQFA